MPFSFFKGGGKVSLRDIWRFLENFWDIKRFFNNFYSTKKQPSIVKTSDSISF